MNSWFCSCIFEFVIAVGQSIHPKNLIKYSQIDLIHHAFIIYIFELGVEEEEKEKGNWDKAR